MFCVKDEEIVKNFKQISKTEIPQYCSKFQYRCHHSIYPVILKLPRQNWELFFCKHFKTPRILLESLSKFKYITQSTCLFFNRLTSVSECKLMDLFSDRDIPGRQFHKEMELLQLYLETFMRYFGGVLWYLAMNFSYFQIYCVCLPGLSDNTGTSYKNVSMSR